MNLLGLLVVSILPVSEASIQQEQPSAILLRARSVVVEQLQGGYEVSCKVGLEMIDLRGRLQRYSGIVEQRIDRTRVVLRPVFDHSRGLGKASSTAEIQATLQNGNAVCEIVREPQDRAHETYSLPNCDREGAPYCPLMPPRSWLLLSLNVRQSTTDPLASRFLGAEGPAYADVGGRYWVLSTEEDSELAPRWKGSLEIWIDQDTGLLRYLVVDMVHGQAVSKERRYQAVISYRAFRFSQESGGQAHGDR